MRTLSALCLAAALAGCVSSAAPAPTDSADVVVQVINNRFNDATVVAELGGRRARLGLATGHQTSTFRIPWKRTGGVDDLRLLIDPIGGGRRITSSRMSIQPGTTVSWTLQPEPQSRSGFRSSSATHR